MRFWIIFLFTSIMFGQCTTPYPNANCTLGTIPLSTIPNVGGLIGIFTPVQDSDFKNYISRVTDSTTDTQVPFSTWVVAGSTSGDENHANCTSPPTKINLSGGGGRDYPLNWSWGTASTKMYVGVSGLANGFFLVHAQHSWGRVCPLHQNIMYVVGNGQNNVTSNYGPQLGYYDFTNQAVVPSFNLLFDFTSSANCLGSSYTVQWTTGGDQDQNDTDFAVGFSNTGGQGTGVDVAVWRSGFGCRHYNISTGTVTGDWGPTGAITGTTCTTYTIHNVRIAKVGGVNGAVEVDPTSPCADANGQPYVWSYTGLNVTPQCPSSPCSGHWTVGLQTFMDNPGNAPPNYIGTRSISSPATFNGIVPNAPTAGLPGHTDIHPGWNALNDNWPICTSSYTTLGQVIDSGWENEILCYNPLGGTNPWRFVHTFNTGINQALGAAIAVGAISQDGRYYFFTSDWENTLGNTSNGSSCIPNGTNWIASTAFGATSIPTINPTTNNAANDTFQATTAGTSGTVQPNWGSVCATTCTDGTVTWTNIGVPNCRGDVFVVQLLSQTTAPLPFFALLDIPYVQKLF